MTDAVRSPLHATALTALVCAAALLLSACETTGPFRPDLQRQADTAAAAGRFDEAARAYEQLADAASGEDRDRPRLTAARLWLQAGDVDRATAALDSVRGPLPADTLYLWSIASAELELARDQPRAALRLLDESPSSGPAALTPDFFAALAAARFATGDSPGAVTALVERETWLDDTAAIAANHERIWSGLTQYGPGEGGSTDPTVAGWLNLAARMRDVQDRPFVAVATLRQWQVEYPDHPANITVVAGLLSEHRASGILPPRVALLLPLSGRLGALGAAVRDGFVAAYYEGLGAGPAPVLSFHDVAALGAEAAYQRALSEGAELIVGPLTKQAIAEVAQLADGTITILALNRATPGTETPPGLFQFALAPEDEAVQAAQRILADGLYRGLALVPADSWGERLLQAFAQELTAGGGRLLDYGRYDPQAQDHGRLLTAILHLDDSESRRSRLSRALGVSLEMEPRRRADAQFVFLAAQPEQGRLLCPQLRFHFAGDLPVYATADIYADDEKSNRDLDGLRFTDMPWIIDPAPDAEPLRQIVRTLWPGRSNMSLRLFAMGLDAYLLMPKLYGAGPVVESVDGQTGRLVIGPDGVVRRGLVWARFSGGVPEPLAVPAAEDIERETPTPDLAAARP